MKLYLSSLGLPSTGQYRGLYDEGKKNITLIPTACNVTPQQEQYVTARTQELTDMGFTVQVLDLVDFEDKKDELATTLANVNGIWVLGGNTFYLNYWLHKSGLAELLPDLLKNGLVYGGESAGGLVAGTTLHGIELLDDPAEAPEIIWDGMGFVDYGILPHKGNAEYAAQYDSAAQKMGQHASVKMLTDEEFIVVG
jgi:dipeptidase E